MESVLFYIFSGVSIISSLLLITRANPLMSALWLVLALAATAGIFALLSAPFLAVIQVLVYAGAIMVLFLFVIMLIQLGPQQLKPRFIRFGKIFGAALGIYFLLLIGFSLTSSTTMPAVALSVTFGDPGVLGELLMTKYLVPFEVISVMLLVAVVGTVVLGKKKF